MNTKIISIRKLLILFTVILVFGFTVKVEATSNFTIDSSCNIVFSAHDPNKNDIPLYGGTNAYYLATQNTSDLGYVGTSFPPVFAYIALDDLTGFPLDPTGTLSGTGLNYLTLSDTNGYAYYVRASYVRTGTTCSDIVYDPYTGTTTTHIIELLPEHGTTTTSTTVEIKLDIYINEEDVGSFFGVKINLSTVDLNNFYFQNIAELNDPTDYIIDNIQATTTGRLTWTYTKELPEGNYLVEAQLYKSYFWGVLQNSLFPIDNKSHSFTVIEGTKLGKITTGIIDIFGGMNSTTSSSTLEIFTSACSPFTSNISTAFLNTNWSIIECLTYLIYPPKPLIKEKLLDIAENLTTKFPLGYVNDFYMILSTTSSSTLAVIDATMPSALGFGSGHRVVLDITHVLDPILNATTTIFSGDNPNTDSPNTLFEITNEYWKKFIYLGALLYILSRIVGSTFIPKINPIKK